MRELAMAPAACPLGAPCPWRPRTVFRRASGSHGPAPWLNQSIGLDPHPDSALHRNPVRASRPTTRATGPSQPACGSLDRPKRREPAGRRAPPQQFGRNCPRGILSLIIPTRGPRFIHKPRSRRVFVSRSGIQQEGEEKGQSSIPSSKQVAPLDLRDERLRSSSPNIAFLMGKKKVLIVPHDNIVTPLGDELEASDYVSVLLKKDGEEDPGIVFTCLASKQFNIFVAEARCKLIEYKKITKHQDIQVLVGSNRSLRNQVG